MAEATYDLVFQGDILAGFTREEVMQRFREVFRLPVEDVERIFGHPRVVLKRNLDQTVAHDYRQRLAGIGMAVSLNSVSAPPAVAVPPAPTAATQTTPQLRIEEPADETTDESVNERANTLANPEAGAQPVSAPRATGLESAPAAPRAPFVATPVTAAEPRELDFEFTGNGFEFFRIWIVNLVLGIVTLGIYSAWAKVRTLRYFYGNTRCDGTSFEYLADPVKILKGRLIGFALLATYSLANKFAPPIGALLMLGFLGIFPWVMVRGLAFRNQNAAWRGVRFGFDGSLGDAYKVFLMWPFLGVLSLGLLMPYAMHRQQQFVIGNSRYGVEPFEFHAGPGPFYRIALALIGTAIGGFLLSMLFAKVFPPLMPLAMVATYPVIFAVSNVMYTNLRYNHTTLGTIALQANYRFGSYVMLMVTNTLAIGLTAGLFYPWAKVRTARYAAQHIGLVADSDLGEFAAAQREQVSAVGGEIGDLFDVDLGI
ncbi:MAG TPA: YjgN family protein [Aromatoleum sp.]|uniref:YjgN family protein n=1 Tax=Aromatoleum sp. TaxID=2307007 RepID=UPI002B479F01|nr:YjgN family protein [Aromatoleum sp.]HJV25948.1 YjgN family protein [Aromatoleum sp.]